MAKITFILGLCASGKSYLANKIIEQTGAYLLDEGFASGLTQFESDYEKVLFELRSNRDCVVIEIALCFKSEQEHISSRLKKDVPDIEIKWLCIENDLRQANKNNKYRMAKGEKISTEVTANYLRSVETYTPKYAKIHI